MDKRKNKTKKKLTKESRYLARYLRIVKQVTTRQDRALKKKDVQITKRC